MMFGNAEAYDRFMGRWSRVLAPLVVDFAAVPEQGRVLDVGTGIGALAFEVAKRSSSVEVTGIDASEEFVAYAITRSPYPQRTSFQKRDAQDLDFPGDTFVAAVSMLVFNFIHHPEKALRELRRVTQRGGSISAAVWDYGGEMRMLRAFWDAAMIVDAAAEKLDERHMPLCRAGQLSQLWKQCDLENVHEQPLEITLKFDSFNDYWEPFLLGQGPAGAYVRTLQDNRRQILRAAVKQQLSISAESEAFTLSARAWAVRGTVPTS